MMLKTNKNKQFFIKTKSVHAKVGLATQAFTLIEIMFWILIVSTVLISWFQALSSVNFWKTRLMSSINLEKQVVYFQEKLFEEIKKWWEIDYEEYFNRKVIWTTFSSWHYNIASWFWNFSNNWIVWTETYWVSSFYRCISWNWIQMTWSWCYNNILNTLWENVLLKNQRYGQYSLQFIDYNSNFDDDWWDENSDWSIIWDDDDEYLWKWPNAFESWKDIKELYLISWDWKKRTLFRWNVYRDPNAPSGIECTMNSSGTIVTWSWCLWTIEFLKLKWVDYWLNHDLSMSDDFQYDWVIDTWIIDKDFTWWDEIIAWSNNNNYWVSLFPDDINVKDFQIYLYPNKDYNLAWKSVENNVNLSPYVRIKFTIWPSWANSTKIKWSNLELNFSTTISLTDIFSK